MSTGVEFEEPALDLPPRFTTRTITGKTANPKMITALINAGIVRSENAAVIVLVAISSLFFSGAILFYMFNPFI